MVKVGRFPTKTCRSLSQTHPRLPAEFQMAEGPGASEADREHGGC